MYLRKTRPEDIDKVMEIIQAATQFLAAQGLPQWQNGHGPTKDMIVMDREKEESFVLIDDEQIVGTAALVSGVDPVYTAIDGSWEEVSSVYLSIHRVAVDPAVRGKGLGKNLLKHLVTISAIQGVKDIRIDTYPTNEPMKKTILAAGFHYRGMIEFPFENGERLAYQLVI